MVTKQWVVYGFMKAVGYEIGKERDGFPVVLQEVTMKASIEEIDELIAFLSYTKERHILERDQYNGKLDHTHLQDWCKEQGKALPDVDLIICTFFEE